MKSIPYYYKVKTDIYAGMENTCSSTAVVHTPGTAAHLELLACLPFIVSVTSQ